MFANNPQSRTSSSTLWSSLNTIRQLLFTIARCIMAVCCAFCLYFLVVCLVSGHSFAMFSHGSDNPSTPDLSLSKQETLKYESSEPQHDAFITLLNSKDDQARHPKQKLIRLLEAKKRLLDQAHLSRYSVMENDLSKDIDESYADCGYHLAFTLIEQFTNEHQYASKLMSKFRNTLSSILFNINSTNLDPGSLCIHLITDDSIRPHIQQSISQVHEDLMQKSIQHNHNSHFRHHHTEDEENLDDGDQHRPITRYFFIDSLSVETRLEYLLPTLRNFFTHKPNSYYSNALFFYSLVLHQVMPKRIVDRLILIDVDIQLTANILELYEEFGRFKPDEVIGIAYEQQPVYR